MWSRRMIWAEHLARMGRRRRMYIGVWWENQKERTIRKTDIGGCIILK
jgi:hypothetical protein